MNILVTGINGFIGKNIIKYFYINKINVIKYEKNLKDIHKENINVEYVLHLAGVTSESSFFNKPFDSYQANICVLNSLLEFCKINNAKMIFVSTCGVYEKKIGCVKEIDKIGPLNSYSTSKYIGELLCYRYSMDFDLPVTVMRLFNVYGSGQKKEFVISYIFNCLINQEPLNMKTPYDLRDFIYIDDVCNAILKAIENKNEIYEVYNVGSGHLCQISDVAEKIFKKFGKSLSYLEKKQSEKYICADLTLIKHKLGWEPEIELEEIDTKKAKIQIEEICKKLLSNTIIEDYKIDLK